MEAKRRLRFHIRLPFFLFIFLVLISGTTLAFSTGGFIVDFKRLGFSGLSLLQSGVSQAINAGANTVNAVKEIALLKQEYAKLVARLEEYEYFQRTNAEIRSENERLKEQLGCIRRLQLTREARRASKKTCPSSPCKTAWWGLWAKSFPLAGARA